MLAGDPDEAAEKAELFLKERSLVAYCDTVVLQGLQLVRSDVERGVVRELRQSKFRDTVRDLVADLAEAGEAPEAKTMNTDAEAISAVENVPERDSGQRVPVLKPDNLLPDWKGDHPLLCIAGRSALDEAASIMMAHLATAHSIAARTEPADALSMANVFHLDSTGVAAVCLIYLDGASQSHMRYTIKRLRRKMPNGKIILCCWAEGIYRETLLQRRVDAKADFGAQRRAKP